MTSSRSLLRRFYGDALVLALFVAAELDAWLGLDRSRLTAALFAPLWVLPLLLRRWSGLAVAIPIAAAMMVESFVYYPATERTPALLAFVSAVLLLGLRETRTRAVAGGIAAFALVVAGVTQDTTFTPSDVVVFLIFTFGPLAGGIVVRERSERAAELADQARRLERARDEAARLATTEERARIADELQAVIARAIGVMTAEADEARRIVLDQPDRARAPIEAVEEAGREALAETRRLLGILRKDMSSAA